ncbi:uncharacterized protein LOC128956883 [Oppia nitens]|uniref:uncharacterized protein LOC128956883 n=1 Tax=Oppia nitens TaxID=1686743 RepID=UPI0023DC8C66|nr:uncharacterized protein LOC128956883 [Oppia nitens]
MSQLVVTDLVDDLYAENRRLADELVFVRLLNSILEDVRRDSRELIDNYRRHNQRNRRLLRKKLYDNIVRSCDELDALKLSRRCSSRTADDNHTNNANNNNNTGDTIGGQLVDPSAPSSASSLANICVVKTEERAIAVDIDREDGDDNDVDDGGDDGGDDYDYDDIIDDLMAEEEEVDEEGEDIVGKEDVRQKTDRQLDDSGRRQKPTTNGFAFVTEMLTTNTTAAAASHRQSSTATTTSSSSVGGQQLITVKKLPVPLTGGVGVGGSDSDSPQKRPKITLLVVKRHGVGGSGGGDDKANDNTVDGGGGSGTSLLATPGAVGGGKIISGTGSSSTVGSKSIIKHKGPFTRRLNINDNNNNNNNMQNFSIKSSKLSLKRIRLATGSSRSRSSTAATTSDAVTDNNNNKFESVGRNYCIAADDNDLRSKHNGTERLRRQQMTAQFVRLGAQIPWLTKSGFMGGQRRRSRDCAPKISILTTAIKYIRELRKDNQFLETTRSRERSRNQRLKQQFSDQILDNR